MKAFNMNAHINARDAINSEREREKEERNIYIHMYIYISDINKIKR
jgi:hypothetical protein